MGGIRFEGHVEENKQALLDVVSGKKRMAQELLGLEAINIIVTRRGIYGQYKSDQYLKLKQKYIKGHSSAVSLSFGREFRPLTTSEKATNKERADYNRTRGKKKKKKMIRRKVRSHDRMLNGIHASNKKSMVLLYFLGKEINKRAYYMHKMFNFFRIRNNEITRLNQIILEVNNG